MDGGSVDVSGTAQGVPVQRLITYILIRIRGKKSPRQNAGPCGNIPAADDGGSTPQNKTIT